MTIFFLIEMDDIQTSSSKRQKSSIPKILDGTYFEIQEYLQYPNVKAKCMTCGKIRAGALNGTSNMLKHYRESHPTIVNEINIHIKRQAIVNTAKNNTKQSTLSGYQLPP